MKKLKRLDLILIIFLMIVGATLRTHRINEPLADWHSWRQSDTASVAWEYTKNGIDLLHPRYQDLSTATNALHNPEGWRFVEFPIINALHAKLYMMFPGSDFVVLGRTITIVASTLTIAGIYMIIAGLSGTTAAFFSSVFFAVAPYNVYYGRVILPEPFMIFFFVYSLYFALKWLDNKNILHYILSLGFLTLSILMKPTALVIVLPIFGYALGKWSKMTNLERLMLLALPAIAYLPYKWWRDWMAQYPEGIPYNLWLFNWENIRFKGAFFRWLFGERISKLILGYWGLVVAGAGLMKLKLKSSSGRVYLGLVVGALSFLSIIAAGNVRHDYYQIQIIPAISALFGIGAAYLLKQEKGVSKLRPLMIIAFASVMGLALSWYEVRGYFNINNPAIVEAGNRVQEITPDDALVIAPYMQDTAFLFQTRRRGWPAGGDIEDRIERGAEYYVTTTRDDEYQELVEKYTLLEETDKYSIIKLTQEDN